MMGEGRSIMQKVRKLAKEDLKEGVQCINKGITVNHSLPFEDKLLE
jgi:hypothetical protein